MGDPQTKSGRILSPKGRVKGQGIKEHITSVHPTPEAMAFFAFAKSSLASGAGELGYAFGGKNWNIV